MHEKKGIEKLTNSIYSKKFNQFSDVLLPKLPKKCWGRPCPGPGEERRWPAKIPMENVWCNKGRNPWPLFYYCNKYVMVWPLCLRELLADVDQLLMQLKSWRQKVPKSIIFSNFAAFPLNFLPLPVLFCYLLLSFNNTLVMKWFDLIWDTTLEP